MPSRHLAQRFNLSAVRLHQIADQVKELATSLEQAELPDPEAWAVAFDEATTGMITESKRMFAAMHEALTLMHTKGNQ